MSILLPQRQRLLKFTRLCIWVVSGGALGCTSLARLIVKQETQRGIFKSCSHLPASNCCWSTLKLSKDKLKTYTRKFWYWKQILASPPFAFLFIPRNTSWTTLLLAKSSLEHTQSKL